MSQALTSRGHEIHVLRVSPWHGAVERWDTSGAILHELDGRPILSKENGNEIFHYATRWASYAKTIRRILSSEKIDVVLSSNLLPSAVAAVLARARNVPVVYDVADFYPDFVLRYGRPGLSLRMLRYVADQVFCFNLRAADRLIFLGKASARFLASCGYNMIRSKPVAFIPNGISVRLIQRGHYAKKLRSLHRQPQAGLEVALIGSLEFWIDTQFVVDFFSELKKLDPAASLAIYGRMAKGGYVDVLRNLESGFASFGVTDGIHLEGFVPHDQIFKKLESIQVGLIPFLTDLRISQCASPVKLLEYMATGTLVVGTPINEVMDIADGTAVIEESGKAAARTTFELFQKPSSLEDMILRGSRIAKKFTWDRLSTLMESELLEACSDVST